jgi:hypothetical protein
MNLKKKNMGKKDSSAKKATDTSSALQKPNQPFLMK